MVEAGWYFCPTQESDDFVTCAYCNLCLDGWEPKDDPLQVLSRPLLQARKLTCLATNIKIALHTVGFSPSPQSSPRNAVEKRGPQNPPACRLSQTSQPFRSPYLFQTWTSPLTRVGCPTSPSQIQPCLRRRNRRSLQESKPTSLLRARKISE
jgi:hypothetical protein